MATAHRQGAKQVVQISIDAKPPEERPGDNPWPQEPKTYKKTYAQEEGAVEEFGVDTTGFVDADDDGRVDRLDANRVAWEHDNEGRRIDREVVESGLEVPADLVLIAIGFAGPEANPFEDIDLELAEDGTFRTDDAMMTSVEGVFAAGDANIGPSLVVWAIGDGRDVARAIDTYLTGDSELPPSIRTDNPPLIDAP